MWSNRPCFLLAVTTSVNIGQNSNSLLLLYLYILYQQINNWPRLAFNSQYFACKHGFITKLEFVKFCGLVYSSKSICRSLLSLIELPSGPNLLCIVRGLNYMYPLPYQGQLNVLIIGSGFVVVHVISVLHHKALENRGNLFHFLRVSSGILFPSKFGFWVFDLSIGPGNFRPLSVQIFCIVFNHSSDIP